MFQVEKVRPDCFRRIAPYSRKPDLKSSALFAYFDCHKRSMKYNTRNRVHSAKFMHVYVSVYFNLFMLV